MVEAMELPEARSQSRYSARRSVAVDGPGSAAVSIMVQVDWPHCFPNHIRLPHREAGLRFKRVEMVLAEDDLSGH